MELWSVLGTSQVWRGRVWGRIDTCICIAESLHGPPETITTLYLTIPQHKVKSSKEKTKEKKRRWENQRMKRFLDIHPRLTYTKLKLAPSDQ